MKKKNDRCMTLKWDERQRKKAFLGCFSKAYAYTKLKSLGSFMNK